MTVLGGRENTVVWTIGHSTHEPSKVLGVLKRHKISVLADVRSAPYSRWSPQFNRPELEKVVPASGIRYQFLGNKLGGRPDDPECYDEDGHVVYDRMEQTAEYRKGIYEILALTEAGERVCLMCSEEDPVGCHRALSIGHVLVDVGLQVQHVRGDGRVQGQEELQGKGLNQPLQIDLFGELPVRRSIHPIRPGRFSDSTEADEFDESGY